MGLAKIKHLHDGIRLKKTDFLNIFEGINSNKIKITEKIDGVNLFFSFQENQIRFAKHNRQIKEPITKDKIQESFHYKIVPVLTKLEEKLRERISNASPALVRSLFAEGSNYYNCEILSNDFSNVISYEKDSLILHEANHIFVNDDKLEKFNIDEVKKSLFKAIFESDIYINQRSTFKAPIIFESELKEDEMLGEYYSRKIEEYILKNYRNYSFPLEEVKKVSEKIAGINKQHIAQLTEDKYLRSIYRDDSKKIYEAATETIRESLKRTFIHMLEQFENPFIKDSAAQISEIRNRLSEDNKKLIENYPIISEGFVFEYKGNVYKLTGEFSKINQLKEFQFQKNIALIPGGFKPPHKGHISLIESVKNRVDEVWVIMSNKSRFTESKSTEFSADRCSRLFLEYLSRKGWDDVQLHIIQGSPVSYVYEAVKKLENSKFFLVTSKKDNDEKRYENISNYLNESSEYETVVEDVKEGLSATNLREKIENGESFAEYLPEGITEAEVKDFLFRKQSSPLSTFSLGEASAMGGGAVVFSPAKPLIKKEENEGDDSMSIRDKIEQDIKEDNILREQIKKNLKEQLVEDYKIKQYIKKVILETVVNADNTPYKFTGINILRELLKRIIPSIEETYKNLTTDPAQRESYRIHVLNALVNTLEAESVNRDIESPNIDGLNEDIEISMGDDGVPTEDDKFIDVRPRQEEDPIQKKVDLGLEDNPLDPTGRNAAVNTVNKIDSQIVDSFAQLSNPKDQEIFAEYLITNLKLYFDKFEEELSANISEPTTDQYEKEKRVKDTDKMFGGGDE